MRTKSSRTHWFAMLAGFAMAGLAMARVIQKRRAIGAGPSPKKAGDQRAERAIFSESDLRGSGIGSRDVVDEASAESFPASDPPAW